MSRVHNSFYLCAFTPFLPFAHPIRSPLIDTLIHSVMKRTGSSVFGYGWQVQSGHARFFNVWARCICICKHTWALWRTELACSFCLSCAFAALQPMLVPLRQPRWPWSKRSQDVTSISKDFTFDFVLFCLFVCLLLWVVVFGVFLLLLLFFGCCCFYVVVIFLIFLVVVVFCVSLFVWLVAFLFDCLFVFCLFLFCCLV